MEPTNTAARLAPSPERVAAAHPPSCPQCGGVLFELRGILRCSQCYFAICEGCEGEKET